MRTFHDRASDHAVRDGSEDPGGVVLHVHRLQAGYRTNPGVVRDVDLTIRRGEVMALIGPNGSGKSTLLRAVYGLLEIHSGDVWYRGDRITDNSPAGNLKRGMAFVQQGRSVFENMSVAENIEISALGLASIDRKIRREYVLEIFPELRRHLYRRAGLLSGGQQQMIALARAMLVNAEFMLLDEPFIGLAPSLVNAVARKLEQLKQLGVTMIVAEHKIRQIVSISSRVCGLRQGRVVFDSPVSTMLEDADEIFQKLYL